jgi:basic membrane protein A
MLVETHAPTFLWRKTYINACLHEAEGRKSMVSRNVWIGALVVIVVVVIAVAAIFIPPLLTPPKEEMKVALIMQTSTEDGSYGTAGYNAMMQIADEFPDVVAVRDYIAKGYTLIYGHGTQFADPLATLAPEFPDIMFTGGGPYTKDIPDNMIIHDTMSEQCAYLGGVVAAMMSNTSKAGIVCGFDYPSVVRISEAFRLGMTETDPEAQLAVVYAGTWVDPAKGKEIANAMIDDGADVITHWADLTGLGALEAARDRGVYMIGGIGDQYETLGESPLMLTSMVMNQGKLVYPIVKAFIEGTLEGGKTVEYGFELGAVDLAPFRGNVPSEVEDFAEDIKQMIISGEIEVPEIWTPQ